MRVKLRNHFSQLKRKSQNLNKAMLFQRILSSIRIVLCQSFLRIHKMTFKIYRILKFKGHNQNIQRRNHFSKHAWINTTSSKIHYHQNLKKKRFRRAILTFLSVVPQELVKLRLLICLLVNLTKMNILKHLDHQINKKRYNQGQPIL